MLAAKTVMTIAALVGVVVLASLSQFAAAHPSCEAERNALAREAASSDGAVRFLSSLFLTTIEPREARPFFFDVFVLAVEQRL